MIPLVTAFTLRPAVYASADRLKIRNPFRSITLPWACVDDFRAAYSTEVFAGSRKYQLWAVPVSLRRRKRANVQQMRASMPGAERRQNRNPFAQGADADQGRAPSDQTVIELRQLAETGKDRPAAQGPPEIRWAYELMAPCVAGAVLLAVLLAVG